MRKIISESNIEEYALDILSDLGYHIIHGGDERYVPGGQNT